MPDLSDCRYIEPTTIGELEAIQVRHPDLEATLTLQGAHLIHFAPTGEDNWLWLSPAARYQKNVAVRGGIPVCWPWFGDPAHNPDSVKTLIDVGSAHGFARHSLWSLADVNESADAVEVTLALDATEPGAYPWRGQARVTLTFRFCLQHISLELTTHNTGDQPLTITQALHTYLPTTHIESTRILGLSGIRYIDTLDEWLVKEQVGRVTFYDETDRIYQGAPDMEIYASVSPLRLSSSGSASTVVWNPGPEKAARLSDFPGDAWTGMLCVETANAADDARELAPGASHSLAMRLNRIK